MARGRVRIFAQFSRSLCQDIDKVFTIALRFFPTVSMISPSPPRPLASIAGHGLGVAPPTRGMRVALDRVPQALFVLRCCVNVTVPFRSCTRRKRLDVLCQVYTSCSFGDGDVVYSLHPLPLNPCNTGRPADVSPRCSTPGEGTRGVYVHAPREQSIPPRCSESEGSAWGAAHRGRRATIRRTYQEVISPGVRSPEASRGLR